MTSDVHRNFVREPMGDKPVTVLPGIGQEMGGRLEDHGYKKAYKVLGQFLLLDKNTEAFVDWLKGIIGDRPRLAKRCADALEEYCNNYI